MEPADQYPNQNLDQEADQYPNQNLGPNADQMKKALYRKLYLFTLLLLSASPAVISIPAINTNMPILRQELFSNDVWFVNDGSTSLLFVQNGSDPISSRADLNMSSEWLATADPSTTSSPQPIPLPADNASDVYDHWLKLINTGSLCDWYRVLSSEVCISWNTDTGRTPSPIFSIITGLFGIRKYRYINIKPERISEKCSFVPETEDESFTYYSVYKQSMLYHQAVQHVLIPSPWLCMLKLIHDLIRCGLVSIDPMTKSS